VHHSVSACDALCSAFCDHGVTTRDVLREPKDPAAGPHADGGCRSSRPAPSEVLVFISRPPAVVLRCHGGVSSRGIPFGIAADPAEWQPELHFYGADPRRRSSESVSFGSRWEKHDDRFGLVWFPGSQELCLISARPAAGSVIGAIANLFGGIGSAGPRDARIAVLGTVASREAVETMLEGWRGAMGQSDSLDWLIDRLTTDQ
jgi:hypothetical protein